MFCIHRSPQNTKAVNKCKLETRLLGTNRSMCGKLSILYNRTFDSMKKGSHRRSECSSHSCCMVGQLQGSFLVVTIGNSRSVKVRRPSLASVGFSKPLESSSTAKKHGDFCTPLQRYATSAAGKLKTTLWTMSEYSLMPPIH
jgi:hypothetical protein